MHTTTATIARIYVGTYAKYNAGSIAGKWLDLEDFSDREDFEAACKELHADESDPELMFQDWEGIPAGLVSESHLDAEFWEWLELDADDREMLAMYREACDQNGNIETAREAYQGNHYSSQADFAQELADDIGAIDKDAKWPMTCIDWDAAARELFTSGDYCSHRANGSLWVFRADL